MKKVDYEHFSRFAMPHSLTGRGEDLYFCVKRADMERNTYTQDLYCYRKGEVRRLTALGDTGSYQLTDEGIVFAACRTEKEKEKAKTGEPCTVFYRMPYDGGEAVPFLTLPYSVQKLVPAGKDRYFLCVSISPLWERLLAENGGDSAKAAAALPAEGDYHVVDEIPFRWNGGGYTDSARSRLVLWENGEGRFLTGEKEDCSILSALEGRLCFSLLDMSAGKMPMSDRLYMMDMSSLEKTELTLREGVSHYGAWALPGNRVLASVNTQERCGGNQNPGMFVWESGAWRELDNSGNVTWSSSVGSDIVGYGSEKGHDLLSRGDWAYFLDTVWDHTAILGLNVKTGEIQTVHSTDFNILSIDLYGDGFAMIALHGNGGSEVYQVNEKGETVPLTELNTALCEEYEYSAPEKVAFTDEAGIRIEGWVLHPAGEEPGKRYPAVFDIHGGPKTVYGTCYFHEMQMWASRGWYVFFCNPVGGDGRGDAFSDIRGHYGEMDYRDLMGFADAVLAACPAIDPARVGVTGGSYGGFMTNWIIGHTDRFAAAASQRSISNWLGFYGTSDIGYFFAPDQTAATPWENHDKAWDQSPLKYAPSCTTPTLFIHSEEDYRCPLDEGIQMFTALRERGVDARMCIFKGENHELSRSGKPRHRVRRLKEITEWLAKYIEKKEESNED